MNLERTAPRGDDLAELVLTAAGRRLLRDRRSRLAPRARASFDRIPVYGHPLGLFLLEHLLEDLAAEDEIHPGGAIVP